MAGTENHCSILDCQHHLGADCPVDIEVEISVTNYRDKKVVVVGAGVSGLALCRLLAERSAHVVLSDRQSSASIRGLEQLEGLPVMFDFEGHTTKVFTSADLIVLSPGVPATIPAVIAAARQGVPIIGEIELAAREINVPVVGQRNIILQ